jgi:hypothetical protein
LTTSGSGSGSGTSGPVPCPLGYYCPTGTGGCAPGTYVSNGFCAICSDTYYCSGGMQPPTACPAGQHSGSGATSASACVTCDGTSTSAACLNVLYTVSKTVPAGVLAITVPSVVRLGSSVTLNATGPANVFSNYEWNISNSNIGVMITQYGGVSGSYTWTPTTRGPTNIGIHLVGSSSLSPYFTATVNVI